MSKKITIRGIIGLSDKATPDHLESSLSDAGGDDIDVTFASPGGFVSDGIEMSNMIRAHAGRTSAIITGQAASMASYIPMVFDHVSAFDNTVFMIHNPMGGILGADHRRALEFTDHMLSLRDLLARAYAEKSGKSIEEINQMMADQTFLYGQEIVDHGFADEIIASDGGVDNKSEAIALAKTELADCQAKMLENEAVSTSDFERAAAYLKTESNSQTNNPPATAGKHQEEATSMKTLKELLAENPVAQAQYDADVKLAADTARAEGETAGKIEGKTAGIDEMKAVYAVALPILSSTHYPEAVKTRVGEKAQEGNVEAVKDFVAMYDVTAEGIKTANAIAEQAEETPPGGDGNMSDAEKSEADFQARLKDKGGA